VYLQYAAQATGGLFNKADFLARLAAADAACKNASDYAQKTGVTVVPQGTASNLPKIDPQTGGAAPDVQKAGFPWWIVLLLGGGALAYYLATKKKSPKVEAKARVRRKRKKSRRKR